MREPLSKQVRGDEAKEVKVHGSELTWCADSEGKSGPALGKGRVVAKACFGQYDVSLGTEEGQFTGSALDLPKRTKF